MVHPHKTTTMAEWSRARRVHLAVRQSLTLLSSPAPATFDEDHAEIDNIDDALRSFVPEEDEWATPSSYVPTVERDWLLDGREDLVEDLQESELLLKQLAESSDLQLLLDHVAAVQEALSDDQEQQAQQDGFADFGAMNDDEEDFGDFQSATPVAAAIDNEASLGDLQSAAVVVSTTSESSSNGAEAHEESSTAAIDGVFKSVEGCEADTLPLDEEESPSSRSVPPPVECTTDETTSKSAPEAWSSPLCADDHTPSLTRRVDELAPANSTLTSGIEGDSPDTPWLLERSQRMIDAYNGEEKKQDAVAEASINKELEETTTESIRVEAMAPALGMLDRLADMLAMGQSLDLDDTSSNFADSSEDGLLEEPSVIQTNAPESVSSTISSSDGGESSSDSDEEGDSIDEELSKRPLTVQMHDRGHIRPSLLLPVDDLTSAEARFMRRYQQRVLERQGQPLALSPSRDEPSSLSPMYKEGSDPNQINLDDLPSYYFSPNVDNTAKVLRSLPWQYLRDYEPSDDALQDAFESSGWTLWDEDMVARLCELDTTLDRVNAQLLRQIQPHKGSLDRANGLIHEFEQNLRLAFMYWERSQEALVDAGGSWEEATGFIGPSVLLEAWEQRDDYRRINGILVELEAVFNKEKDLNARIDSFDTRESNAMAEYSAVAKLSSELAATVSTGQLSGLRCLDELRTRLGTTSKRFWNRLLSLSETVVVRSCRSNSFDWIEYERLVQTVLDLHSNAFDEDNNVDLAVDWSRSITSTLCHEADRALAVALLDPTDASASEFEKELAQLAYEINYGWGDGAKLRTLTHNLVVIRFDFEAPLNYLPRVCHKLLRELANILHTHFLFQQWHRMPFAEGSRDAATLHSIQGTSFSKNGEDAELAVLLKELLQSRSRLWAHCERVVIHLLGEYLNFSSRSGLFSDVGSGGVDDSRWMDDLDGLQTAMLLLEEFACLRRSFLGTEAVDDAAEVSVLCGELFEMLGNVCRRHLRIVHVEAMNRMGRMLASETWILTALDVGSDGPSECVASQLFKTLSARSVGMRRCVRPTPSAYEQSSSSRNALASFIEYGNPFGEHLLNCVKDGSGGAVRFADSWTERDVPQEASVFEAAASFLDEAEGEATRLVLPTCVSKGIIEWLSRLLCIARKIPLVVEDVSAVVANLCDLYLTTVLRVCAGCAKNERILLDVEQPSPFVAQRSKSIVSSKSKPTGSPLFGSFRRQPSLTRSSSRVSAVLPTTLEGEICAPLVEDRAQVAALRQFIQRAQASLRDVVSLDKVNAWLRDPESSDAVEEYACGLARVLEKREAAAWSCSVVAASCVVFLRLVAGLVEDRFSKDIGSLQLYVTSLVQVAPHLIALARRISGVRAVDSADVVRSILIGTEWDECKLHEHPNEYIDSLSDRLALLWGFLCVSAKLPPTLMSATWNDLVSAAYMSMLEGFARVPICSTEGRALMALDLSCFLSHLTKSAILERLEDRSMTASPPPAARPWRSAGYVSTYIKVFYYPPEDAFQWVENNFERYQMNHCVALIKATCGGDTESAVEPLERVRRLYTSADPPVTKTGQVVRV